MNPSEARTQVYKALREGRLKSQPCERCEKPKAYAHHDDYEKPLDVTWLCPKCHAMRHRELGWGFKKVFPPAARVARNVYLSVRLIALAKRYVAANRGKLHNLSRYAESLIVADLRGKGFPI